ncbi:MAG TPA: 6-pyruvoyl-tetrahydropterin synthase-related protein [Candidatus Eisenbacteria bacterium]|nr:6-pyruvoyl-tetrahydropterin synthase-related protein [Candidatus Eisenbacteria bacterium]
MKNKEYYWISLLIICSVGALIGLFHSGFFVSDDGHWMIIRLSAFYEGLSSGQFPVRFLPQLNQGFGYPVADFLYPLFLYVGAALHVVKIPFITDIKILLGASMLLSGIGMYVFLKQSLKAFPAFLGGVVYMYLPYHLYDMYIRGSVGEIVSLAIVPFLFWAVEKKSWVLLSIFLGLLILSHNTLALFFLPVIILYACINRSKLTSLLISVGLGLGLASFFWIPALFDRQYTIFNSVVVANSSHYFLHSVGYQLVGWIALALFGGVIAVWPLLKDKRVLFFFCLGIVSLFFSTAMSSILWQNQFLSQFVQFPFRFLSLTLIAESFLAGILIQRFSNKIVPSTLLLLLLGFSSWPYLIPKHYDNHDNAYYATNLATTTVQNEYMPKWVEKIPTVYSQQRVIIPEDMGTISNIYSKGTKLSFAVDMKMSSLVKVAYVYFPGWSVVIDTKKITVTPSSQDGLVQFLVPKGKHTISVAYHETMVQLLADIVTILSIGVVILFFVKKRYEK